MGPLPVPVHQSAVAHNALPYDHALYSVPSTSHAAAPCDHAQHAEPSTGNDAVPLHASPPLAALQIQFAHSVCS